MSLTIYISDEEISIVAVITGDDDPASTQNGLITKFAGMGDELKTALEAAWTAHLAHDHSGSGKGAPLGKDSSGNEIDSFADGAFDATKIDAGAVTGSHIVNGSIGTSHIQDDTIDESKLGDAVKVTINISGSSTYTWNPGLGYVPSFHIEGEQTSEIATAGVSSNSVTFANQSVSDATFKVVYRGG